MKRLILFAFILAPCYPAFAIVSNTVEALTTRRAHSSVSDGFYNNGSTTIGSGNIGYQGNTGSDIHWNNFLVINASNYLSEIETAGEILLKWEHSFNNNASDAKNMVVDFLGAFNTDDNPATDTFMRNRYEQSSGVTQVQTFDISAATISQKYVVDVTSAVKGSDLAATNQYLWFRFSQSAVPDTDVNVAGGLNTGIGTADDGVNELSIISANPEGVPTVSEWGLIILALIMLYLLYRRMVKNPPDTVSPSPA